MRTLAKDKSFAAENRSLSGPEAAFMHRQSCHGRNHTGCKNPEACAAACTLCKAERRADDMAAWERQKYKLNKAASLWLKASSGSPNVALKAQAELEEMGI